MGREKIAKVNETEKTCVVERDNDMKTIISMSTAISKLQQLQSMLDIMLMTYYDTEFFPGGKHCALKKESESITSIHSFRTYMTRGLLQVALSIKLPTDSLLKVYRALITYDVVDAVRDILEVLPCFDEKPDNVSVEDYINNADKTVVNLVTKTNWILKKITDDLEEFIEIASETN